MIEAVGPGVTDFAVGDRVATVCRPDCAYAEARIAPAVRVVKLPADIDERTAASMMVRGMTARYLLHATYKVKPGDTIVIHAAAGGVGHDRQPMGETSRRHRDRHRRQRRQDRDRPRARLRSRAALRQFRRRRFARLTGGKGVPVVYDSVGRTTFENSLKCLAPRGILASFGESSGDPPPVSVRELGNMGSLFVTHPSLIDYTATPRRTARKPRTTCSRWSAAARSRSRSTTSYPLREAAQAHRDVESAQDHRLRRADPLRRDHLRACRPFRHHLARCRKPPAKSSAPCSSPARR